MWEHTCYPFTSSIVSPVTLVLVSSAYVSPDETAAIPKRQLGGSSILVYLFLQHACTHSRGRAKMLCMLYKMIHKYTTVVYHTCVQEEVTNQTTSMSEFCIAISATELLVLAMNLKKTSNDIIVGNGS